MTSFGSWSGRSSNGGCLGQGMSFSLVSSLSLLALGLQFAISSLLSSVAHIKRPVMTRKQMKNTMAAACHSLKKRGFSAIKLSDFIAVAVLYTPVPCDPCLHLLQASSRNLPLPPNQQRKFYFLLIIGSLNHITSTRKLFEKKKKNSCDVPLRSCHSQNHLGECAYKRKSARLKAIALRGFDVCLTRRQALLCYSFQAAQDIVPSGTGRGRLDLKCVTEETFFFFSFQVFPENGRGSVAGGS